VVIRFRIDGQPVKPSHIVKIGHIIQVVTKRSQQTNADTANQPDNKATNLFIILANKKKTKRHPYIRLTKIRDTFTEINNFYKLIFHKAISLFLDRQRI
jgi:hypothetical protein